MRIAHCPHTCLSRAHEKAEAEASAWIREPMSSLRQAGFRERVLDALADDEVIQHPHADQRQRGHKRLGKSAVSACRLWPGRASGRERGGQEGGITVGAV